MTNSERRALFATGSIHVVGPSGDKIMEDVMDWDDTAALERYIDLFTMRFVQGSFTSSFNREHTLTSCIFLDKTKTDPYNSNACMFKACLLDYLYQLSKLHREQVLNFLDLDVLIQVPVS
jgi:hypothetical protein